jgi:histone H3/H4
MDNNCELTIEKLAPLIRRKKISPVELTRFLLDRISQLQPSINAYITITSKNAIAQARQAEREIVQGHYRGVLHGIPISLKDLFYTKKIRTTAGSKILEKHLPKINATVVDRLLSAGCILIGKTNFRRIQRRQCRIRYFRASYRFFGNRHRRIHSYSSIRLWMRRAQTHLWSYTHGWSYPAILQPGSCWSFEPLRNRCRASL